MSSSSTCGARRSTTCAAMGLPRKSCNPLSTPPMRLPCPPASTMPVTSIIGVRVEGRPGRAFLGERIHRGHAIDGCHEKRERQVHLVAPVVVLGLEREARAAARAELAPRAFRRDVFADELGTVGDAALRALEADPGAHARRVRRAAAVAIAMGTEA